MPFDRAPDAEVDGFNRALLGAPPLEILQAALSAFPGDVALVSSFGAESAVLLHMVATTAPATPVLFLDTGQLFAQTLDYRRGLARALGLTDVRDLRPAYADLALEDPDAELWRADPDRCCDVRKVRPLDRGLAGFKGWITGRKRFQSAGRARLKPAEVAADGRIKFNPLVDATPEDLLAYAAEHALPEHPLKAFGYPSIGCWPCTRPVRAGEASRAGRWAGLEKTECGIHTGRGEAAGGSNVGGDI